MTINIPELFRNIDEMDTDKFVSYLTQDSKFTFGNADTVTGKENIKDAVSNFFKSIKGLHHTIKNTWIVDNTIICEIEVTYTRHDEKKLVLPCVNIFEMQNDKVHDYKIFIDISALYA